MRALPVCSVFGLRLAGPAAELSDPRLEVVQGIRSDSSAGPRSDKRGHSAIGSEEPAHGAAPR
jgi:hypothetical protein